MYQVWGGIKDWNLGQILSVDKTCFLKDSYVHIMIIM